MEHTTKTAIIIGILVLLLGGMGFFVSLGGSGAIGAAVTSTVACFQDSDCDDEIAATKDICRNPGTEDSLCVNKPVG